VGKWCKKPNREIGEKAGSSKIEAHPPFISIHLSVLFLRFNRERMGHRRGRGELQKEQLQDKKQSIAKKALLICEIVPTSDPFSKLKQSADPNSKRADVRFLDEILKRLEKDSVNEAEGMLDLLKDIHGECPGGS
jgi:hypothetical protein